ncbi:anthranilate synthase component I family protein [Sphingobacterium deserti]|uniref:Aminodeoxychorismate synthase n=1 Tax=Sphingobacterium deserti TaxID=1229276 RepID=A0A0B8T615_9SPHI|nr:anthranilate synthase component I family protein [Sphingobacterium deserti]KGE12430.1 aminodeoxychorismate synthase [Sphingobacterium deserti]
MAKAIFDIENTVFERQALHWAQQFNEVCFLQSNDYVDPYSKIKAILAVEAADFFRSNDGQDAFAKLENFRTRYPRKWIPGFFSYDLKNDTESLRTPRRSDNLQFPEAYFFVPKILLRFLAGQVEIEAEDPNVIFLAIQLVEILPDAHVSLSKNPQPIAVKMRFSKAAYIDAFEHMQQHIQRGDIYEVNLCQEFYADAVNIPPLPLYQTLNRISPTPFSCFLKIDDNYILSASPERFLAKRNEMLISQPIKGTAARGNTEEEDRALTEALLRNPKEIAENIMIVDLVRNDLTRSATPGTVDASRRLELHSFKQVHQLISTVTCLKNPAISDVQAIKNTFPPGSMTGAPKIKAMELCEQYEASKRGIYSGAVGYFSEDGDFDFNVVIRSILYNKTNGYLSFHTGGAITLDAQAEKEYEECILKASAILAALSTYSQ